jgi:hypothetical protein
MKGACLNAISTTHALFLKMRHDAIVPAHQRPGRAGGRARWIIAVETRNRNKKAPGRGIIALFKALHPPQGQARRRIILQLAGNFTGMALDTSLGVKNDPFFHALTFQAFISRQPKPLN